MSNSVEAAYSSHHFSTAGYFDDATCDNCGIGILTFNNEPNFCPKSITTSPSVAEIEAQTNAVAWVIGIIDELHIGGDGADTTDRLFKGVKNTIRDRYKAEIGVDPAPNYPIKAQLRASLQQQKGKS